MARRYVDHALIETRVGVARNLFALSPHAAANGDLLLDAVEGILYWFRSGQA